MVVFALVHASFQVGVSVLTLLSSHSLSRRDSLRRLIGLNTAYIAGTVLATATMLVLTIYLLQHLPGTWLTTLWYGVMTTCIVVGLLVIATYYRRGKGTMLWLPRAAAAFLTRRAKRTRDPIEAAMLGATTVVAELPFTAVIFVGIALLVLYSAESIMKNVTILVYSCAVTVPLMLMTILIAGGHRLSTIQRWRESNKDFLQYAAGLGLLVIALCISVFLLTPGEA